MTGPSVPVTGAPLGSDDPAYAELRARRRRRVFKAMAAHDVDVLILGRPAEVTYATGLRQLWVAGSRPYGPAAILIAATGAVHLLAISDDGAPDEIGAGDLFALSWNPANIHASVAALEGFAAAKRVATTSFSPGFDRFVTSIASEAEIVDGANLLHAARQRKSPGETRCIEAATTLAADALTTMRAALKVGITERDVLAVYLGRLAELGVPTPPTEGVVAALDTGDQSLRMRRVATSRRVGEGDRVVLDVSADAAGYEGGLGTTVVVGESGVDETATMSDPLRARTIAALDAMVDACRPGATAATLRAAATSTGEAMPVEPIVIGVGIGVEPPVVTADIGDDATLESSMVVAVSAWVAEPGVGGWFERRLVEVGEEPAVIGPVPPLASIETER